MKNLWLRNPGSRDLIRLAVLALLVLGSALSLPAADENTRLIIQIQTDETKKPVQSAHVIVRFVSGKKFFIKDKHTSWEAQTNKKGEVVLDELPMGHVKIQVIAKGYQTYGEEFDLTKEEENMTILLKPPAKQVSAY